MIMKGGWIRKTSWQSTYQIELKKVYVFFDRVHREGGDGSKKRKGKEGHFCVVLDMGQQQIPCLKLIQGE